MPPTDPYFLVTLRICPFRFPPVQSRRMRLTRRPAGARWTWPAPPPPSAFRSCWASWSAAWRCGVAMGGGGGGGGVAICAGRVEPAGTRRGKEAGEEGDWAGLARCLPAVWLVSYTTRVQHSGPADHPTHPNPNLSFSRDPPTSLFAETPANERAVLGDHPNSLLLTHPTSQIPHPPTHPPGGPRKRACRAGRPAGAAGGCVSCARGGQAGLCRRAMHGPSGGVPAGGGAV